MAYSWNSFRRPRGPPLFIVGVNDATVVGPSVADRHRRISFRPDLTGPPGPLVNHGRRKTLFAPFARAVEGVNIRSVALEP